MRPLLTSRLAKRMPGVMLLEFQGRRMNTSEHQLTSVVEGVVGFFSLRVKVSGHFRCLTLEPPWPRLKDFGVAAFR
jgi:hypothetical protein